MSCNNNAKGVAGVAFGCGISGAASQNSYIAGREAAGIGLEEALVRSTASSTTQQLLLGSPPKTRLEPSNLGLLIDGSDIETSTRVIVKNGFVVLRLDGMDTGLAVTPGLNMYQSDNGPVFQEDTSNWWVLHIPSGRTISQCGYSDLEEANKLASMLARQDWTMVPDELTEAHIKKARETIAVFDELRGHTSQ